MATVTIQTYLDGEWHDAATVDLANPYAGIGSPARFEYDLDYWIAKACTDDRPVIDERAVSVTLPVDMAGHGHERWHSFLLDLIPQGNMRRKTAAKLHLRDDSLRLDYELLMLGAGSPIGNVRIKEAWQADEMRREGGFEGLDQAQMLNLDDAFLRVWERAGLSAAGSEGVQGEWPKILMTQDADGLWYPDPVVPDDRALAHCLMKRVKADGSDRFDARAILAAEPGYLEMARNLGLRVAAPIARGTDVIAIPRFDRLKTSEGTVRMGQESIVSALGVAEWGHSSTHEAYLAMLRRVVSDPESEVVEYVMRDLLNMAAGNPDNHGRNTAIQKRPGGHVALTPLFDFAPMRRATDGGRVTKWARSTTLDHAPDWSAIAESACGNEIDPRGLLDALRNAETFIRNLPAEARRAEVPEAVIEDNIVHHVEIADTLAAIPAPGARP